MSNWIDDEAEKFRAEEKQKQQGEQLINYTNYWAGLRAQIEKDVRQINQHSVWREKLNGADIKIVDFGEYYRIEKSSIPAVFISVKNEDKTVNLIKVYKKENSSRTKAEKLAVEAGDERIYLKGRQDSFLVPEQAAQHILSSIIDVLKES